MKNCITCNAETNNPRFCSRNCAAKHNNKTPKRKLSNTCMICKKPIRKSTKHCMSCWKEKILAEDMTLEKAIYTKHHRSSAYALIRQRARKVAKDNDMISCEKCGYDKHVEIAHIKSISSFSKDTLLSLINDLSNLKALCPNCHWEFDNLST